MNRLEDFLLTFENYLFNQIQIVEEGRGLRNQLQFLHFDNIAGNMEGLRNEEFAINFLIQTFLIGF